MTTRRKALTVLTGVTVLAAVAVAVGWRAMRTDTPGPALDPPAGPAAHPADSREAVAHVPAGGPNRPALVAVTPSGEPAIRLDLPRARFIGTVGNLPPHVRIHKTLSGPMRRKPFVVPARLANVARGRPVTSSDADPVIGTLDLITDGNREAAEDAYVEVGPGVQYVQIDLGRPHVIHAVAVWHEHKQPIVYHDVVVQAACDKDFIDGVADLYSNDHDNSAGLGIGRQWEYVETNGGLIVPAKGVTGRYVRLYGNGSTADDLNRYTEVAVYGTPAE